MRARAISLAALLVACGSSFEIPPDLPADRPHARAVAASTVSFDEDAGAPPFAETTATLPEIADKRLSNGIRVLLVPKHDLPLIDFAIVIKRGAEDNATPGFVSTWIEAATRSTDDMSMRDLNAWLNARGAQVFRWAGYAHTQLGFKCLTPLFDQVLDVAAKLVLHPTFDEDALKRATSDHTAAVVSARSSPGTTAYRAVVRALYPTSHPYGTTVLGEEVHPTRAEVEAYWRENVTASSLAIVASGDFDVDATIAKLEARFGKLRGTTPAPKAIEDVAPHAKHGVIVSAHAPQVHVAVGFVGAGEGTPDRAALHVAALALRDATLHDIRLVEGATYATSVFEAVRRGPAPIVLQTAVDPQRLVPALKDIWRAIEGLRAGLSEEDTVRFRQRAVAVFPSRFDTVGSTVGHLADLAALDLPATQPAAELEALRKVTAADVARVAQKYMTPETIQVAVVGELAAIKPAEDLLEYKP